MRLLWITNFLFPEISEALGINHKYPNGWTYSAARLLHQNDEYTFAVAAIGPVQELVKKDVGGFTFYVLPETRKSGTKYYKYIGELFKKINDDFKPDVVHLYGTEYPHSYAYLQTNKSNVVISLQGLVSAYAKYFLGGISYCDVYKNLTFHDLIRKNLLQQQNDFIEKGKKEIKCLKAVSYIEGRTSWDKAISTTINPNAQYFYCPRILRDVFYSSKKWNFKYCNKYTIFISQSHYPIKGGHKVFEALPIVKRKYPEARIIVGGVSCTNRTTVKEKLYYSGYGKFLNNLVRDLGIEDSIVYTGPLNAIQMCEQYLKCHVFVCSSSIENSPNSVAEAQILGTPLISSFTGGVPDMITHGKDGYLYRFEEVEMLASLICDIFSMQDYTELTTNEIETATLRHDRGTIINTLKSIYSKIYKETHQ